MSHDDFKRIVTAFADNPADIDSRKGRLLVQVRDEIIDAGLSLEDGVLMVEEHDERLSARSWIVKRLARLPLLAERICSHVSPPEHFVPPAGRLLGDIGNGAGESDEPDVVDAAAKMLRQIPGTTSVWYLTADAGEGKTSLIDHLAVRQARAYKNKETDWLLVPVPLGGRTFLRFDDVVVATLVNRLRFQLLYYDAFLELVRLGVVVPAFDGFEEMIIEGSSGEAMSALGQLVNHLGSAGTALIAARKAYFEYLGFGSQARLFTEIDKDDVMFGRLSLQRWDRLHFVEYARRRGLADPERLFDDIAARLPGPGHPLLTRAVLVRRLVDVALDASPDLSSLLDRIDRRPQDYFHEFVTAIVEREAREKWVDRSGVPPRPLLTVDEHHELLSIAAREMWLSSTDALRADDMGFVAELFAENAGKPPAVARQIQERMKQHALIVVSRDGRSLGFDHDDFRLFYLGEALGRALVQRDTTGVKSVLGQASLPRVAVDQAAFHVHRHRGHACKDGVVGWLHRLAAPELPTSFVRENCGALTAALVDAAIGDGVATGPCAASHVHFPEDALRGRSWQGLTVRHSYFAPTSLTGASLVDCRFEECRFDRLGGHPERVDRSMFDRCEVGSVVQSADDAEADEVYAPAQIRQRLRQVGFSFARDVDSGSAQRDVAAPALELSEDLKLTQRALRIFLRATTVGQPTMEHRLRTRAGRFRNEILPRLLDAGILEEVRSGEPELPRGTKLQRRFRVAVPMQRIEDAMRASDGEFGRFVQAFAEPRPDDLRDGWNGQAVS